MPMPLLGSNWIVAPPPPPLGYPPPGYPPPLGNPPPGYPPVLFPPGNPLSNLPKSGRSIKMPSEILCPISSNNFTDKVFIK